MAMIRNLRTWTKLPASPTHSRAHAQLVCIWIVPLFYSTFIYFDTLTSASVYLSNAMNLMTRIIAECSYRSLALFLPVFHRFFLSPSLPVSKYKFNDIFYYEREFHSSHYYYYHSPIAFFVAAFKNRKDKFINTYFFILYRSTDCYYYVLFYCSANSGAYNRMHSKSESRREYQNEPNESRNKRHLIETTSTHTAFECNNNRLMVIRHASQLDFIYRSSSV